MLCAFEHGARLKEQMMKRTTLIRVTLLALASLAFCSILLRQDLWRSLQAAQRAPQAKENFDIRANLQRTLNDPAEAEINVPLAAPDNQPNDQPRTALRRSTLPYALRRAHPSVQMKWSSLTQAPSRVWSFNELLSPPSQDDAEVIARRFLRNNEDLLRLDPKDIAVLQVARRYQDSHNGLTHLTLQQQIDGIEVFQADLSMHIAKSGEVVALSGEALPNVASLANTREPGMPAAKALRSAAEEAGATLNGNLTLKAQPVGAEQKQLFDRGEGFSNEVEARLVYFPLTATQVRLAWQFMLWMKETPDVYLTLIDAERGTLLYRYNLTSYDENPLKPHGPVFTRESPFFSIPYTTSTPPLTPREDVPFRAAPFNGTEIFPVSDPHYDWWAGRPANNLITNNTDTRLDRDGTPNQPDLPRLEAADGHFNFPLDFTKQPTDADYQKAAQVNLFYWVNRYHDILYQYGFTEAAGNFQTDNFGRGGRGNDAIFADAQDGSGVNNANFLTPPDGTPGRVQMYIFTTTNPNRDGDLEQGIIIHELTHGLSNRLVGNATGLSGMQAGGMGEGWSDYFAVALLRSESDDLGGSYPQGQWVTNNYPRGVRRFPYSTSLDVYPLTFKDLRLSTQVHAVGEIWCNTLLEMRALLIRRLGFREGQRQSLQLVVDGLKLTPRAPTFLDARNAILLADRINNGGANQCTIWQAFSKRGMGFDAETTDGSDGAPIEALITAPYCSTLGSLRTDKPNYIAGETLRLNLGDANATGTLGVTATTTVTGDRETLILQADRNLRGSFDGQLRLGGGRARFGDGVLQGSVEAGDEIVLTYTDTNTGSGATQVQVRLPFVREKVLFEDDVEAGNRGWLPSGTWSIVNTRGASPVRSWTDSPAGNYANNTNAALISPQFDLSGLSNITLSFAQSYNIEEGFDSGGIEISTDDGQTWRRVAAVTGTQSDFRQAVVRLRGLDNQPRARLRFRLVSDNIGVADGWYVDDIRLTGRSASPALIPPGTSLEPRLASVTPAFGPPAGGTRVTIFGANFTEAEDTVVTFDGVPAAGLTLVSSGVLTAIAPPHRAGPVPVQLSNRHGSALLGNGFTYFTPGGTASQPELTSLYPDFGSTRGGTVVTVLGQGFTPETTVNFGGRAGRVTFVNATTLRVSTPIADAAGRADVTVANGTLTHNRTGAFNYINPTPPTVDVVTPDGGESFFVGSTINLRWSSADNAGLASHRLSLFRPSGLGQQFVADLATNLAGSARSYNWTIPASLTNGEYRLRIIATDNEGAESEAYSTNSFLIGRRWEVARPLPTPVGFAGLANDGRNLYLIGGRAIVPPDAPIQDRVLRWNPAEAASNWTPVAPLPTPVANLEAIHVKGKIYVPGGLGASAAVSQHFVYDPVANTWATLPLPFTSGSGYALAADEARGVYYFTSAAAFRVFNTADNSWSTLPTPRVLRLGHEAALIEGKLYLAGGTNSAGVPGADVFDFSTNQWSPIATPNFARRDGVNFVVNDSAGNPYWVIVGGSDTTAITVVPPPEAYDVRNNRWIPLDNSFNLTAPRNNLAGTTLGAFFYVAGSNSSVTGVITERYRLDSFTPLRLNPVPPVLYAPTTHVTIAGLETQFEVLANDLGSGIPLSINASGLPQGATFTTLHTTHNAVRGVFRWTPAGNEAGRTVTLNFTASDGNLSDTKIVTLRVVAARPLAAVNAADFRSGVLAPDSIAALFGTDLAVRTDSALGQPLPFDLAGTTVTINGLPAPLLFVSPAQLNFIVPAALQPGPATIVVSHPAGTYAAGTVQIAPSVPALFTRDQSGRGEALALVTDGVRVQTPPFDVLTNGRPNVLVLFGTGFRRALAASPRDDDGVAEAVSASIGGRTARVLFAGAQGGLAGLDQLNLELPASLAGGGARNVEVVLTVNGEAANRVTIPLR
jgi:uncharacterized protein (TIGR03437 family)